ncbi:MAG: LptE family protein [Candidatus Brocadiia bacterium]
MKLRHIVSLCIVLAVLGTGCGYRAGGLMPPGVRTVYVEAFDNETFRRGLEVDLTRALVAEIELRTPLVFATREEADSILSGELLEANEQTRIKSQRGRILLQRTTVKVRFRWRDRLTGAEIIPEQTVTESAQLASDVAESGTGIGGDPIPADLIPQEASFERAFQEAAQRVVERMEGGW